MFRETYDDLEANIISTWLKEIPQETYTYNSTKHIATLVNGTSVKFRYVRSYKDANHYQGRSIDYIGIDELTKHLEETVQELLSCLRSPKHGYPTRFRATGNPGGIGHRWVKKRYITKTKYGKRKYRDIKTGNSIAFIPATVRDNPYMEANDPKYKRRLENLPKELREAYLEGNWDVYTGQAFPEWDPSIHVCKPFEIPSWWRRWRCVDNGYADPFYWGWLAVSPDGQVFLYREYTRAKDDPRVHYTEQAKKAAELSTRAAIKDGIVVENKEGIDFTVAGLDAWNTHHRDQQGKMLIDYYSEGGVDGFIKPITDRRLRKGTFHEYFKPYRDEVTGEWTSKLQIFDTCKVAISTLPELVEEELDPEVVADCEHDHCLTGDTIVNTCDGDFYIRDLVGKEGWVFCYDTEEGHLATAKYYDVRRTAVHVDIYEIEMEDGRTIRATSYHPVLTQSGWKLVSELTNTDSIIDIADEIKGRGVNAS